MITKEVYLCSRKLRSESMLSPTSQVAGKILFAWCAITQMKSSLFELKWDREAVSRRIIVHKTVMVSVISQDQATKKATAKENFLQPPTFLQINQRLSFLLPTQSNNYTRRSTLKLTLSTKTLTCAQSPVACLCSQDVRRTTAQRSLLMPVLHLESSPSRTIRMDGSIQCA